MSTIEQPNEITGGANASWTLPNGGRAHQITPEEARKGALKSAAKRREAARRAKMSLHELIAEKLESRADDVVETYFRQGVGEGDWRALDALQDRVYGKPTQRTETTVETSNEFERMSPEEQDAAIAAVRAKRASLRLAREGEAA